LKNGKNLLTSRLEETLKSWCGIRSKEVKQQLLVQQVRLLSSGGRKGSEET